MEATLFTLEGVMTVEFSPGSGNLPVIQQIQPPTENESLDLYYHISTD